MPPMAKTRFEILLDKQSAAAIGALLNVPIGEADRVWYIRGVHAGLQQAGQVYREAQKAPDDEADTL